MGSLPYYSSSRSIGQAISSLESLILREENIRHVKAHTLGSLRDQDRLGGHFERRYIRISYWFQWGSVLLVYENITHLSLWDVSFSLR